jgi:hypothetical protein
MKDEIHNIINEVANTPSIISRILSPEWCTGIRSGVELQHLQSSYEELYNRHMANPHEITSDLYTKMTKSYGLLRDSYMNLVKDHAVLKDDLERLTWQLAKPVDVCDVVVGCFILAELTVL